MGKKQERERKKGKKPLLPTPTIGRHQRSAVKKEFEEAIRQSLILSEKAAELLRKRHEEDIRNRPPAPEGKRGDGHFHTAFIRVGQGDCTIMTTPMGHTIMIDCGSAARDVEEDAEKEELDALRNRIHSTVYGEKFLENYNELDVLILTHPDEDHYNMLKDVLDDYVRIHNVYYSSRDFSKYSSGTSDWIRKRTTNAESIKSVVHNKDGSHGDGISINNVPVKLADESTLIDRLDDKSGIRIFDEEHCKVTILASNVQTLYVNDRDADRKNRASVVTLVEPFDKKLLICGDATVNTEQYLLNTNRARLVGLTIVQAAHHGSTNTSSGDDFIEAVDPQEVIISAGKGVVKNHLPSQETIDRYEARFIKSNREEVPLHEEFYWTPAKLGSYVRDSRYLRHRIYITGSRDTTFFSQPPGLG